MLEPPRLTVTRRGRVYLACGDTVEDVARAQTPVLAPQDPFNFPPPPLLSLPSLHSYTPHSYSDGCFCYETGYLPPLGLPDSFSIPRLPPSSLFLDPTSTSSSPVPCTPSLSILQSPFPIPSILPAEAHCHPSHAASIQFCLASPPPRPAVRYFRSRIRTLTRASLIQLLFLPSPSAVAAHRQHIAPPCPPEQQRKLG